MKKEQLYTHPKPNLYRLEQYSSATLALMMIIAVALLILVAVLISAPLFFIMALLVTLLLAPVLMRFVVTPPVSISDEGLRIQPLLLPEQRITWENVQKVAPFPLLPTAHTEVTRRAAVGRKKYQEATGTMLVIQGLPLIYRIAGFFAGEKSAPIIAVTNRTHIDYEQLIERIEHYTQP